MKVEITSTLKMEAKYSTRTLVYLQDCKHNNPEFNHLDSHFHECLRSLYSHSSVQAIENGAEYKLL
jgi:hypothetical protein